MGCSSGCSTTWYASAEDRSWRALPGRGVTKVADEADEIQVLIVDALPAARLGLRRVLESPASNAAVVGEAGTVAEALDQVRHTKPDVVVLGWLTDHSPVEALVALREAGACHTLALLEKIALRNAQAFLDRGGNGCISASSHPEEFAAAVKAVAEGRIWISANIVEMLDHYRDEWIQDYFPRQGPR